MKKTTEDNVAALVPAPEPESPILVALRARLQEELNKRPFGLGELTKIASIAEAAKKLIQTTMNPLEASRLVMSPAVGPYFANGGGVEEALPTSIGFGSNGFETFGARVLRDLMPLLTKYLQNRTEPRTPRGKRARKAKKESTP